MAEIETTDPEDQALHTPGWPPYEPPPDAVTFDDVELLDAEGAAQGCIIASAYFADYYCANVMPGWTWRHYVPPAPEPDPEAEPPPEEMPQAEPQISDESAT